MVRSSPAYLRPITSVAASAAFKFYDSNWPLWNQMIAAVKNSENFDKCPQLVFYSDNDPMCNKAAITEMFENWEGEKFIKSWPKSAHAAHLLKHEKDYLKMHGNF